MAVFPCYGLFFVPACNKDVSKVTQVGLWKTSEKTLKNLSKLMKVEESLANYRIEDCGCCKDWCIDVEFKEGIECECQCHSRGLKEDQRSLIFCFDSRFKEKDNYEKRNEERKQYYNKLLNINLVHPGCGDDNQFHIIKVSSNSELKKILKDLRASIW